MQQTINKKLFIKSYGCQMNVYDSTKMYDILHHLGYEQTEEVSLADVIILNTCHIREKAAEKVYCEIGRIKKLCESDKNSQNKKPIVVVAGCTGQAEGAEIFARAPYVDVVVGPQSYHSLPALIARVNNKEKRLINLDFVLEEKFDLLPENTYAKGASSYISVQEGCDKFCTFCVVPYTRGAEFSRPLEKIYREVLQAVSQGAKEIYLLGQNVNAYHGVKPDGRACSLSDLINHISQIPEVERIRYTTSHPLDMTDDLIRLFATQSKLMPFLHLPIQSGSDKILKEMNRKHDRQYYLSIIDSIKNINPNIALSSDFIVGFPGETDEDFADTLDIVEKVQYSQCYSFKYSPRPGTPATYKPQIPEVVKTERLNILQAKLTEQALKFNKKFIATTIPVLFTREGKLEGQIIGKTPHLQSVYLSNSDIKNLHGKIVNVLITEASASSLTGTIAV